MKIGKFAENYAVIVNKALETFASGCHENVVLSPFSMVMLLAILADATKGEAHKEILAVIARGIYNDLTGSFAEIQKYLTDAETFVSSNAVCVKKSLENSILPEFKEKLAKYGGEFFASENCVEEINGWVNEKTKGMIKKIVNEPMNPLFMATLMNAVAFEAKWGDSYKDCDIKEEKFTNASGYQNTVDMLKSSENSYIEDDFFIGFVKPYQGDKYSFMALLPKKKSMKFFDKSLQTVDFVKLFKNSRGCKVHVTMPEFKYCWEHSVVDFCKELGINTIFSQNADFSPFSSSVKIKIDEMIQKAYIEVNRKGTKAKAVTYCQVVGCSPFTVKPEVKTVRLNRPFIYAIVHNKSGVPVFVGTVKHLPMKGVEKITKEYLAGALRCLVLLREYDYDGTWEDIELGFSLYDISVVIEEKPEYFDCPEIKEQFDKAMKALEELIANNVDYHFLLEASLGPGRDLFPDKKKHWWWWMPEKVMNKEQLREWKKYLKKEY